MLFDYAKFVLTEEMLLVVKRTDFMPPEENLKGPTVSEVLAATKHVPLSKTGLTTNNINMDMLQSDVRIFLRYHCSIIRIF